MKPEDLNSDQLVSVKSKEFDAVISFARTALKIPILINGGAAIAILALIGNTWGKNIGNTWGKNSITTDLAGSLLFFSIGVFVAAVSTGVSYLTQFLFQMCEKENDFRKARKLQLTAIILVIISYILFMVGAWWAYDTFSSMPRSVLKIMK